MKQLALLLILTLTLLTTSCANQENNAQSGIALGALGGALLGQAIGHDTEATLIGAAVGTMLGYIVGNEMDKYDREQLNHTYERGVSGQKNSWKNPDSGNYYEVTPQPAYVEPKAQRTCRQAEIIAIIDGQPEKTYTTACRDNSGHWQLQN
ncbi:MAG: glycine zipper 2TM domain-containing protein [Desulfobulbaceae bacterium]|uniref:Glycine zipper 2TM domain-containing protein n=1 Tax=Candidatus Desulfatifera sulfidica TaxID=2841691 RepID=A0A8J6NBS3_9BACT|nr:glycine zipper 2TM domain-containing protein [Candidatus Desulfatifera sulfidica]